MKDATVDILKACCKNTRGSIPCDFIGLTGSVAVKKHGGLSDYDLLVFVSAKTDGFWPKLSRAVEFLAATACLIQEKQNCNVIVASSLLAEDLMPFVRADQNVTKNVLLHILLYPSPEHFVRWEPAVVRHGLLEPFDAHIDLELMGTLEPFRKNIDPQMSSVKQPRIQNDKIEAIDICLKAFITGMIQAYCHSLYKSEFVACYAFHLLRYAARYLISYDDRVDMEEMEANDIPVSVPITAQTPDDARILMYTWLRAWRERNDQPLADQLPSLYDSALIYFHDIYDYLLERSSQDQHKQIVVVKQMPWTFRENAILTATGKASADAMFVVSGPRMRSNIKLLMKQLRERLGSEVKIWYSVKSFPSRTLINYLVSSSIPVYYAAASQRELDMLLASNVLPGNIILHAPAYDAILQESLRRSDVAVVSVGSFEQCKILERVSKDSAPIKLLARLTCPTVHGSKFGFTLNQLETALDHMESIFFAGIHMHLGENLYSNEVIGQATEVIAAAIKRVCRNVERPIINLGGGWRSRTYEEWFNVRGIDFIHKCVTQICERTAINIDNIEWHFEFGHRIVEDAVVALCHVVETRMENHGDNMHILNAGTSVLPSLKSAVYGVSAIHISDETKRISGILAGPACYEADRFSGSEIYVAPGDLVVFSNAGAYTLALASGFGGFFPKMKLIEESKSGDNMTELVLSDLSLW